MHKIAVNIQFLIFVLSVSLSCLIRRTRIQWRPTAAGFKKVTRVKRNPDILRKGTNIQTYSDKERDILAPQKVGINENFFFVNGI